MLHTYASLIVCPSIIRPAFVLIIDLTLDDSLLLIRLRDLCEFLLLPAAGSAFSDGADVFVP
jgi:hypothetical protein